VRPNVQEDSLINLKIYPTISDLTGWSPKGMPIVFERSLSTEVNVRENAMFVLGGLKKREVSDGRKGIPGLKEVPVLQWFFSVKKKIVLEREVLIFIRPTTNITTDLDTKIFDEAMEKYKEAAEKEQGGRKRRQKNNRQD
jgi:type II secretory pathway component GspD/PulD (secretin)